MPGVPGVIRGRPGGGHGGSARRWPLSRIIGVALLILLLFSVAAMVAGGLALLSLHDNRERVVGTIDPAQLQVQRLDTALVNQETGVRGYALSGQKDFLAPYNERRDRGEERDQGPAGRHRAAAAVRRGRPEERDRAGPLLAHALRPADHQPGQPDRKARGQRRTS